MLDTDKLSDLAILCKIVAMQLPEGNNCRESLEEDLEILEAQINAGNFSMPALLQSSENIKNLLLDILQPGQNTLH